MEKCFSFIQQIQAERQDLNKKNLKTGFKETPKTLSPSDQYVLLNNFAPHIGEQFEKKKDAKQKYEEPSIVFTNTVSATRLQMD